MKQQIRLYTILVAAFALLSILACSPLDYFIVTRSSSQPPTPEVNLVPATVVSLPAPTTPTYTPVRPPSSSTLTPGANGPLAGWKSFTSANYQYSLSYPYDWTVTVENPGTMGEAKKVERVIFKQPNYGKPNQFSTITIEAAQGAYSTTGQCQGQSEVVPGIKGCRRSMPKAQNPAQEVLFFQAPPSGNVPVYFYMQLVYDDAKYVDTFNQVLKTFKYTAPAGSNAPGTGGQWKTFASTKHHYTINYPSAWTINVQTSAPAGSGRDPEYVYLRQASTGLPTVEVLALKGAPPVSGFEKCNQNLQFRGVFACSISLPKGQMPATQLLVFQKGDSHYQLAMEYEAQQQLAVFEEIVKSFQFTP